MTPQEYLRMQQIDQMQAAQEAARRQPQPNRLVQALPYAAAAIPVAAGLYGANALASDGNETWQRTAENTAGNLAGGLAGAYAGSRFGLPGAVVGGIAGALGGGYVSDRIADQFDPNDGQAMSLLDAHLQAQPGNPYEQEAQLRQQIQQVQMAQRQQQAAMRQQAMQQYQGQQ